MAAITYAPGLGIHFEGLGQQVLVEPLHKDGVYPIVASLSNEIPPVLEPNGYQLSQLVDQSQGQIHHEKVPWVPFDETYCMASVVWGREIKFREGAMLCNLRHWASQEVEGLALLTTASLVGLASTNSSRPVMWERRAAGRQVMAEGHTGTLPSLQREQ